MTDRTHPDSGRITTSGDVLTELHDRIAELEQEVAHTDGLLGKANALARIRAHHIAELEAQLEAIGAGGVSGPLVKGFDAADMATASAQGFRDGAASVAASAGSEPVAWRYVDARGHFRYVGYKPSRDMSAEYPLLKPIRLYLHPSPPEGMVGGWMPIETAPKSSTDGRNVDGIYLLGFCPEPDACNLQSYICIVWWEPNMKGGKGMWYGEGGYEVHPTHWMPLPPPPTSSADSRKGE